MNQYTLHFFFRDKAALKYFPFKIKRQQKKKNNRKIKQKPSKHETNKILVTSHRGNHGNYR